MPSRLAAACLTAALAPLAAFAAQPPNVLVIVTDDAGSHDYGFMGCKDIPTPNMDSIARRGVYFKQGYVAAPVCAPSRFGLVTGRRPSELGSEYNGEAKPEMQPLGNFIFQRFKRLDYTVGIFGKWHLGRGPGHSQIDRGADWWYNAPTPWVYFPAGMGDQKKPVTVDYIRPGMKAVAKKELTKYYSYAIGDEVSEFITAQKGATKPWFAYMANLAPHSPLQPDPAKAPIFAKLPHSGRRTMAGMISPLDDAVGATLAALEKTGQLDNTLIVLINDNGGALYGLFDNTPLRDGKGSLFEGGIRVAYTMWWPGKISGGRAYPHPVTSLDIVPTTLAAAGADKELADYQKDGGDGKNLLPYIADDAKAAAAPHADEPLIWRHGCAAAVRLNNWKLVRVKVEDFWLDRLLAQRGPKKPGETPEQLKARMKAGKVMLFDLATDIAEKNDLAAKHPEVAKRLLDALESWEKTSTPARQRWEEGVNWERIRFDNHTGEPVYRHFGGEIDGTVPDKKGGKGGKPAPADEAFVDGH